MSSAARRSCFPRQCLIALLALTGAICTPIAVTRAQPSSVVGRLVPGILPDSWTDPDSSCADRAPFRLAEYTPDLLILRQSGCTHYEKPFLYLVIGEREALLVDTGAPGVDIVLVVDVALQSWAQRNHRAPPPLLVVHSHGHGDHTAGDRALRARPGTRVVAGLVDSVKQFFAIPVWPGQLATYDLGGRVIDVVPIPGHEPASIAIYDRRTGILLTGDTMYPGRLYVADAPAFVASVDRLVEFTRTRPVTHVLGAHIEQTRTPFVDYPIRTRFQPEEHALALSRGALLELQDALRTMPAGLERRALRDFTVWPK